MVYRCVFHTVLITDSQLLSKYVNLNLSNLAKPQGLRSDDYETSLQLKTTKYCPQIWINIVNNYYHKKLVLLEFLWNFDKRLIPYLLGGGGGGGGAPLDGGGGGGLALTPLEGFPEDFAPPESKDGISTTLKSHLFFFWTHCNLNLDCMNNVSWHVELNKGQGKQNVICITLLVSMFCQKTSIQNIFVQPTINDGNRTECSLIQSVIIHSSH